MENVESNGCDYDIENLCTSTRNAGKHIENVEAIIDHFVNIHGCHFTQTHNFQLELSSICSEETFYGYYTWTPVIVKLEEERCYVLIKPIVKNEMLGWLTLVLPFTINDVNKTKFQLEFKLCSSDPTNSSEIAFTQTPFSIDKLDSYVLNNLPYRLSLSILEAFAFKGDLLFNCRIKPIQEPLEMKFDMKPPLVRLICKRTRKEFWANLNWPSLFGWRDILHFLSFPPMSIFLLILWMRFSPDPLAAFLNVQFPADTRKCREGPLVPLPLAMLYPICIFEDDETF